MNRKIGPALAERMEGLHEEDLVPVNVILVGEPARDAEVAPRARVALTGEGPHEKASYAAAPPDPDAAVAAMQEKARQWQAGLCSYLESGQPAARHAPVAANEEAPPLPAQARVVEQHWINNSVTAEVSPAVLRALLERDDVLLVELVRDIPLEDLLDDPGKVAPKKAPPPAPGPAPAAADQKKAKKPKTSRSVKLINAPELWLKGLTGEGVVVAVIDTGVNYNHPDLSNRMWDGGGQHPGRGRNFVDGNDDPMDLHGHGTCCAGVVAGDGTSGTVTGVAPGARVMALKADGEQAMVSAMEFAIAHKAHVISMSMSLPSRWKPNYTGWRRTCESVLKAGILHVNSIGNDGQNLQTDVLPFNIGAPANCPPPWLHPAQNPRAGLASAIACGAANDENELDGQSGQGPAGWSTDPFADYPFALPAQTGLLKPDICGPGPDTETCDFSFPGKPGVKPYTRFGGTSAATPHVAGSIALLVQACVRSIKPVVPERILEAIESTAVQLKGQQKPKENNCGAGRIDVLAAYEFGVKNDWWA